MSDYDSSLPIRSEKDGLDERLHAKLVDYTNPDTQQLEIDTDNNAHVEMHGNDPAGVDVVARLSQEGAVNGDGDYDGTNNTKPSSSGLIAHDRNATPTELHQNKRVTAVSGGDDTVCLDVGIRDESGNAFTEANPLPIFLAENPAVEVDEYKTEVDLVKDASITHDYTVTALKTLLVQHASASASGKIKAEISLETAAASDTYNVKEVRFNSTANPNIDFSSFKIRKQVAGAKVRITITNVDNQDFDVYSNLLGFEK